MPPRLVTAAIIVFWLAMTGWLLEREVVPMMLADASPTYQPDLTDEIGSPVINWEILHNGKHQGSATSRVRANDDRSYDFSSTYLLNGFPVGVAKITSIDLTYQVSDDGKLRAFATKVTGAVPLFFGQNVLEAEFKGKVVDGESEPRVFLNKQEQVLGLGKVKVEHQGHFVNSMHLLNRLRGLRAGRTWKITLPDLMGGVQDQLMVSLFKQMKGPPVLIAVVETDTLLWDRKEVPCYKIEYREQGKDEVAARTWARQRDGLVLQQESAQMGIELVLQRMP
jgi:hypothetical protein